MSLDTLWITNTSAWSRNFGLMKQEVYLCEGNCIGEWRSVRGPCSRKMGWDWKSWTKVIPLLMLNNSKIFLSMATQRPLCQSVLIIEASRSYSDTPHTVGLLRTSDQPNAESSTWQHTALTTDRISMSPAGFKPKIAASQRPQTHALDSAVTGIGSKHNYTSLQLTPACTFKVFSLVTPWRRIRLEKLIVAQ
jgi:hypothetical protein